MRTFKNLILFLLLAVFTGCQQTPDLMPSDQSEARFFISCDGADGMTRSSGSIVQQVGDDTPRIADLNIWLLRGDICTHAYVTSTSWLSRLQKGTYELFILANAGQDLGLKTAAELSDLRSSDLGCDERNTLLLASHQQVQILSDVSLQVELERVVARAIVNIALTPKMQQSLKLISYQVRNIPQYAYLFEQPGVDTPAADDCTFSSEVVPAQLGTSISDVVYLYENRKPENPAVASPAQKNPDTAPAGATFIHVLAGSKFNPGLIYEYYCYLGENDTSSFSIRRNTSTEYAISISGTNTADVRVNETFVNSIDEGTTWCDMVTYPPQNSTEVFDLGTYCVENSAGPDFLTGRCYLQFPAGDLYSFDDGRTWSTAQADTPVLLTGENNYTFSIRRNAASIDRPHKETTAPFTLYYGLDGNRVPLLMDMDYTRYYGYRTKFNITGMSEDDLDVIQCEGSDGCYVMYGDAPMDMFWYGDNEFYLRFRWPGTYKLLGFWDKFGTKFNPTDLSDNPDTSWGSGSQTSGVYWSDNNRGSGSVDLRFEEKTFDRQQSLYVSKNTAYTISLTIGGPYTHSEIEGYNVYTMTAGTQITASMSATGGPYGDTAKDFAAWELSPYSGGSVSNIGTSWSGVSFTMAESAYLAPTWNPCTRLDYQERYANCYMVHTTDTFYSFSIRYGGSKLNPLQKPYDVVIEWADALDNGGSQVAPLIDYNYDAASGLVYIRWKGSQMPRGSVLFKARQKKGLTSFETIWTWHIWFTDYYPVADAYGLMTRNLGALADANDRNAEVGYAEDYTPRSGYLYQPGRQVPFISGSGYTIENSAKPQAENLALAGHGVLSQWGTSAKGTADPCPYGWRVAAWSELLSVGSAGWSSDITQQSFFRGDICLPGYGIHWAYNYGGGYSLQHSLSARNGQVYNQVEFATAYATADGSYVCPARTTTSATSLFGDIRLDYGDSRNTITPIAGLVRCVKAE